jgi:uncharacterized protein involved in exopolysaccharide biosynthesis
MQTVIEYESKKAHEQVVFLQAQFNLSKIRFEKAQAVLSSFNDRNRSTFTAGSQVDAQRLQNEYDFAFDLYRKLGAELEQAKIKENQDTPVFTVLEDVYVPNKPVSPNRIKIFLMSIFAGLFLGIAYLILVDIIRKQLNSLQEEPEYIG